MFELLIAFCMFIVGFAVFGVFHAFQYVREERRRKRFIARWKDRMRVRSLLRLIKGGKSDTTEKDT